MNVVRYVESVLTVAVSTWPEVIVVNVTLDIDPLLITNTASVGLSVLYLLLITHAAAAVSVMQHEKQCEPQQTSIITLLNRILILPQKQRGLKQLRVTSLGTRAKLGLSKSHTPSSTSGDDVHCVLKIPDPCDILKYFQQIWTDINNFWYRESSINLHYYSIKLACEM